MVAPACALSSRRRVHGVAARMLAVLAILGAIAVAVTGCLTADTTLKADGSGTMEMTYLTPPNTTAELEKRRYTSPHVTVDSVQFSAATTAILKAHFDDVTKLNSAEGFKSVSVTRSREGDDEVIHVTIVNALPATLKEEGKPGPKITVTFPGAVREAGPKPNATVSGDKVTWSFGFVEWMQQKKIELTARWAAADAGKPADAPAADAKPKPALPAPKDAPAKP